MLNTYTGLDKDFTCLTIHLCASFIETSAEHNKIHRQYINSKPVVPGQVNVFYTMRYSFLVRMLKSTFYKSFLLCVKHRSHC